MLMTLYNVSLNHMGLVYLINEKVHDSVADCTGESPEIQLKTLRLIQSMTYDLKDMCFFDRLLQIMPIVTVQQFIKSTDERIAEAATGILTNVKQFYATADTISDASTCI